MQHNIRFGDHIKPTDTVVNYIEQKLPKIENFFKKNPDDEVILDITFDKNPDKDQYWTTMNLSLAGIVFHVKKDGIDAFTSIDHAKVALLAEYKSFKEKMQDKERTVDKETIIDNLAKAESELPAQPDSLNQ